MIDWVEPASEGDVFQSLAAYGEDARLVAGGTWVTLVLQQGFLFPSALISLRHVPDLNQIAYDANEGLTVGAMVTHRTMETHSVIREQYPMLAQAFGVVANVRIRNQATVGGCLCDADYASDPPAMLVALDANVHLKRSDSARRLPVEDFITGHYETRIEPGELLTHVSVPPQDGRGIYIKYRTRSHEDRPCVGVAVVMTIQEDVVSKLRVVVGAVADRPQRFADVEALALGKPMTASLAREIANAYADNITPLDDQRGSSWYRTQMIRVLVRRAILGVTG